MPDTGWTIVETEFDPARIHHLETVFTVGNGYLGTRGAFEEGYPGAWPATLIHGVFDDVPMFHTELANCPDWTPLAVIVAGERFRMDRGEVLGYRRALDLRRGMLSRDVRWRSPAGHTVDLHFERFASLADPHVLAVRCEVTPVDDEVWIEVQAGINGYQDNRGIMHWHIVDQGDDIQKVWLHSRARHSGLEVGMAASLSIQGSRETRHQATGCDGVPTLVAQFKAEREQTINATKLVSVYTSRDLERIRAERRRAYEEAIPPEERAALESFWADMEAKGVVGEPRPYTVVDMARDKLDELFERRLRYPELLEAHAAAWDEVWAANDVVIEGDPTAQLAVRYNLFQALIAAPRDDNRVSIPAKTLSGFGYRGHVFWDTEIFLLPLFTYTQPDWARNLLTYRYHALPGARRKAKAAGYEGAMFAWESADTGDEVTPRWLPGPQGEELVRVWCGDIELHITADVAYAVWQYWQATGDDDWMRRYGAEIILDTAVFWGSRVEWNADRQRYEISDVIGPDEYHEHVDNNAFTNRMVQWHLETALEVLAWLREVDPDRAAELASRLDLTDERLRHWNTVREQIFVPHDPETRLIEQFEGYFELQELNLADYEPRHESMMALLGIEGINQAQVLKQPDVLMLLYLLRHRYDQGALQVNWDYYAPRTDHTHGSSLGPAIHAILACRLGRPQEAYEHFIRAALVDLGDVRGNAADGIHAASTGGLWQAVVFGFGGVELTEEGPVAKPHLPAGWDRLKFRLQHRGHWYDFDLLRSSANQRRASGQSEIRNPKSEIIRGVIFDLDGVLTDTSEYHYLAWKRMADEEGILFDREMNEQLRGISRADSLRIILGDREVSDEGFQELMDRKNRYYQEYLESVTPDNLLPGALPLLEELRSVGIKVAIGSASKNTRTVVERLGIVDILDATADGYSVEQQKPAPDLFLYAAEQLGMEPQHCLVVEDAESGVEAALAGGMWAVGLGPHERVGDAHVVLPNLEGVRWAGLFARLATLPQVTDELK